MLKQFQNPRHLVKVFSFLMEVQLLHCTLSIYEFLMDNPDNQYHLTTLDMQLLQQFSIQQRGIFFHD